jgi:hypothetical protein
MQENLPISEKHTLEMENASEREEMPTEKLLHAHTTTWSRRQEMGQCR